MRRACDTSLLVAALVSWHPQHEAVREQVARVEAVPAHVLIETYSVLTRLPAPHRIAPLDAQTVVEAIDLHPLALPAEEHRALLSVLGAQGVRGGAVYDALVGATARHHGCTLLTRDRRARVTYDAVGVSYALV